MEGYNNKRNIGYKFSVENFENGKLINKLRANYIQWNEETKKWTLNKYEIRTFHEDWRNSDHLEKSWRKN